MKSNVEEIFLAAKLWKKETSEQQLWMSVQLWDCLSGVLRKEDFRDVTQICSSEFLIRQRGIIKLQLLWHLTRTSYMRWVLGEWFCAPCLPPALFFVRHSSLWFLLKKWIKFLLFPCCSWVERHQFLAQARNPVCDQWTCNYSSKHMKHETQKLKSLWRVMQLWDHIDWLADDTIFWGWGVASEVRE